MYILGVYCGHDASACIIEDGRILVNIEKERLTRRKGDVGNADICIQYCLDAVGLKMQDIDIVATSLSGDPTYRHSVEILTGKVYSSPEEIYSEHDALVLGVKKKAYFIQHHISHAALAYYSSPFDQSAILSLDGWGDFTATLLALGNSNGINVLEAPLCNIGTVWVAFCTTLGFGSRHSEGTLMALASLGDPIYYDKIRDWAGGDWRNFRIQGRGRTYKEALEEIWHHEHEKIWRSQDRGVKFTDTPETWYGVPIFKGLDKSDPLKEENRNIAASLQKVTEDIIVEAAYDLYEQTHSDNICLSGGVALNCVANSEVLRRTPFKNIYVAPATHDGGLAMGNALYSYHAILKMGNKIQMTHPYYGYCYSKNDHLTAVQNSGYFFKDFSNNEAVVEYTANLISRGKIVGWFQGGSECGPRALGHRSIVCDPRSPNMKDVLNNKVKHRVGFRPFAPSILEEEVSNVFQWDRRSPFMLFAAKVMQEFSENIPAVLHVDQSARLQTVNEQDNGIYYDLIEKFHQITGIPLILNTSFNDAGEPIVETPEDAVKCFSCTEMDCLTIGQYILSKNPGDLND